MVFYTLETRSEGRGQTLVFLHGIGASSRYFQNRLGTLPQNYRCVLPDLLGFGASPKPADCAYTITDHLDALHGTLADRGVLDQPVTLVGHSLGAILAVEFAARFPKQVAAIVLLGLPRYASPAEARAYLGGHGDWFARLVVANGAAAHVICRFIHFAPSVSARLAVKIAPQFPPEVAEDAVFHTWESYSRTLRRCVLEHDLDPALRALIATPVLALHGRDDHTSPLAAVVAWAETSPHVSLRILPDGHHLFLWENAACIEAIAQFAAGSGDHRA